MKKLLICLVVMVCMTGTLFAFSPREDLKLYPVGQEAGDLIINIGVSDIWNIRFANSNNSYWRIPHLRATFDYNVALGGLPFFMGGIVGYSVYGYDNGVGNSYNAARHSVNLGFRFGYHFNFDVKGLDVYALASVGGKIRFWTGPGASWHNNRILFDIFDWLYVGVDVGARYFVTDWLGFWVEAGFAWDDYFKFGVSLKF